MLAPGYLSNPNLDLANCPEGESSFKTCQVYYAATPTAATPTAMNMMLVVETNLIILLS